MPRTRLVTLAGALLATAVAPALPAQSAADRATVERAVLDYVEGFYEGDSTKLARSVSPEVHKFGFFVPRDSTRYVGSAMPFPEFFAYARRVRENSRQAPASAIKRVELLDVLDQTAAAKLTANWGIDYLLLARVDGRWMIRQVLWQTPPRR